MVNEWFWRCKAFSAVIKVIKYRPNRMLQLSDNCEQNFYNRQSMAKCHRAFLSSISACTEPAWSCKWSFCMIKHSHNQFTANMTGLKCYHRVTDNLDNGHGNISKPIGNGSMRQDSEHMICGIRAVILLRRGCWRRSACIAQSITLEFFYMKHDENKAQKNREIEDQP